MTSFIYVIFFLNFPCFFSVSINNFCGYVCFACYFVKKDEDPNLKVIKSHKQFLEFPVTSKHDGRKRRVTLQRTWYIFYNNVLWGIDSFYKFSLSLLQSDCSWKDNNDGSQVRFYTKKSHSSVLWLLCLETKMV